MRELRLEKSLTFFQVAVGSGCQPSAIHKWESGDRIPMADNLFKLAQFFGVSIDYLVGLVD